MKVLFVRHGESEVNALNVFGSAAHIDLTEKGRDQARSVGRTLSVSYPEVNLIVSSTMKRARLTTEVIAEELNLPTSLVEFDERIIEVGCGDFEGMPLSKENMLLRDKYLLEGRHERNVEAIGEIIQRISAFTDDIKSRSEKTILIVGHGFTGRMILRMFHGLPPTAPVPLFDNAEIIILEPYSEIKAGELML